MNRSQQLGSYPTLLFLPCWLALATPAAAGGGDPGGDPPPAPEAIAAALQDGAPAQPASLRSALAGGDWWLNLRLRYEGVQEDGFDKDANALTLRTVLGYETAAWHGFSALLEFEDVTPVGGDGSYNSTVNGVTDRPVVADPDGSEVNQASLGYRHGAVDLGARSAASTSCWTTRASSATVIWRQNEQTYDAASAEFDLPLGLDGFYAYVAHANRINGDESSVGDAPMDAHLLHFERELQGLGPLSLYDYYLDFDTASFVPVSTNSLGVRFVGKRRLGDALECSTRWSTPTRRTSATTPSTSTRTTTWPSWVPRPGCHDQGGWEVLGGDGSTSFQTPLATLHAFNGWADKFLTHAGRRPGGRLPATGPAGRPGPAAAIGYHDFSADSGGDSYGKELDLAFTWPLAEDLTLGLKAAGYDADDFATDTTKAWIWLETSL